MTLRYQARQIVRKTLAENTPVRFLRWATDAATFTPTVMRNVLALAGPIHTVIDVGASDGRWSARYRHLLPEAQFLLFEANPVHFNSLNRYARRTGSYVEQAAASDRIGETHFLIDPRNPLGGAASVDAFSEHDSIVATKPIDVAVRNRGLTGPFFLKLDTQGHEPEIFAGAAEVLANTSLVIVEAYGVGDAGRMAFDDLCLLMRGHGFRAAGIADPVHRPSDNMLWQMDIAFIRHDHPAFTNHSFWE